MRGLMLAAVLAAGVAGQAQDAEAGTLSSTWLGEDFTTVLAFDYINPDLEIDATFTGYPWMPSAEVFRHWWGEVRLSLTIDGVSYSGAGTGSGYSAVRDGTTRTTYSEYVTGQLDDGRTFTFDAHGGFETDRDYLLDLARAMSRGTTTFSSHVDGDMQEPILWIDSPDNPDYYVFRGVIHVSAIPIPAAAPLLGTAVLSAAALKLRRRKKEVA